MSYLYLASPYSHPEPSVREQRYIEALSGLNWLLTRGFWAFSPIVHNHPLVQRFSVLFDAEHWADYNRTMMLQSRGTMVLCIGGWDTSTGVINEIEYTHTQRKPVKYLHSIAPNRYIISSLPAILEPGPRDEL